MNPLIHRVIDGYRARIATHKPGDDQFIFTIDDMIILLNYVESNRLTHAQCEIWIDSANVPAMTDLTEVGLNTFYAMFRETLFPQDKLRLEALGFTVTWDDRAQAHHRYLLVWSPAP